jgi:hypothetical protein
VLWLREGRAQDSGLKTRKTLPRIRNPKRKSKGRAKNSSAKKAVDKRDKKKDRTLLSVGRTVAMQSRMKYDRDEAADEFLIDSCASSHMSATDEIMINLRESPSERS